MENAIIQSNRYGRTGEAYFLDNDLIGRLEKCKDAGKQSYIVAYTNPNNVSHTSPYVHLFEDKAGVNDLVRSANQYPGSYHIIDILKISPKGKETSL